MDYRQDHKALEGDAAHLLPSESHTEDESDDERQFGDSFHPVGRRSQKYHIMILYIVILLLFTSLIFALTRSSEDPSLKTYSPVNRVIEYEQIDFLDNVQQKSAFQGPPSDDIDALWDDLYGDGAMTVISADEASKLPHKTASISGTGGQHVIQLEVFHQLHCLNVLRRSLYPEQYPKYSVFSPNGTKNEIVAVHIDHCVDRLRQALICHSDVGSIYYSWSPDFHLWVPNFATAHTCRNFEKVQKWAFENKVRPGQWNLTKFRADN